MTTTDCSVHPVRAVLAGHGHGVGGGRGPGGRHLRQHGEESSNSDNNNHDAQVYMFSIVVIANFWIHILTPLLFMLALCCSKLGVCSCATRLWSLVISVGEHWTRHVRWALALGSILKH